MIQNQSVKTAGGLTPTIGDSPPTSPRSNAANIRSGCAEMTVYTPRRTMPAADLRAREQAMRLLLCASVFSAAVVRNSGGAALMKMHTPCGGTTACSSAGQATSITSSAVSSVRRHSRRRNSGGGGILDATAATSAAASSSCSPADQEKIVTVCGESLSGTCMHKQPWELHVPSVDLPTLVLMIMRRGYGGTRYSWCCSLSAPLSGLLSNSLCCCVRLSGQWSRDKLGCQ